MDQYPRARRRPCPHDNGRRSVVLPPRADLLRCGDSPTGGLGQRGGAWHSHSGVAPPGDHTCAVRAPRALAACRRFTRAGVTRRFSRRAHPSTQTRNSCCAGWITPACLSDHQPAPGRGHAPSAPGSRPRHKVEIFRAACSTTRAGWHWISTARSPAAVPIRSAS